MVYDKNGKRDGKVKIFRVSRKAVPAAGWMRHRTVRDSIETTSKDSTEDTDLKNEE